MNRQQYKKNLEANSKYCECSQMEFLREQFTKTSALERECWSLSLELKRPLPLPVGAKILREYKEKTTDFGKQSNKYFKRLYKFLENGDIIAKLNIPGKEITEISYENMLILSKQKEKKIFAVTLHCSNCDQQVEVAY